jgi:hypothetical protein
MDETTDGGGPSSEEEKFDVNKIMKEIKMPKENEDWFILKNKNGEFISETTFPQQIYIAQELSKRLFGIGDSRYALLSTQRAYDLIHSDENFKEIMDHNYIFSRELILESGHIIPEPEVNNYEKKLDFILRLQMTVDKGKLTPYKSQEIIEVEVDSNSIIGTLIRAGLMKKTTEKITDYGVNFRNGLCCILSRLDYPNSNFRVENIYPSFKSYDVIIALEKLTSPRENMVYHSGPYSLILSRILAKNMKTHENLPV